MDHNQSIINIQESSPGQAIKGWKACACVGYLMSYFAGIVHPLPAAESCIYLMAAGLIISSLHMLTHLLYPALPSHVLNLCQCSPLI